jgi:3-amino-4-hydroxybenzoic acid synthase
MPINQRSLTCHLAWIDLRDAADPKAIAQEAIHVGAHGLLADDAELLATLPPSVQRVGFVAAGAEDAVVDAMADKADILIFDHTDLARRSNGSAPRDTEVGAFVLVHDQGSLDIANACASRAAWTVIDFEDPTKIPLEIVLAAADKAEGRVITLVHDLHHWSRSSSTRRAAHEPKAQATLELPLAL